MRHTDWIEQCAETLSQSPEHPTDKYLKAYIDVQSLAGQSHALFHERRYPNHPSPNTWERIVNLMTRQQTEREQLLPVTKDNNCKSLPLYSDARILTIQGPSESNSSPPRL